MKRLTDTAKPLLTALSLSDLDRACFSRQSPTLRMTLSRQRSIAQM